MTMSGNNGETGCLVAFVILAVVCILIGLGYSRCDPKQIRECTLSEWSETCISE